MQYLIITFLTFLFIIFVTPYFIVYLNSKGIVDPTGDVRRINTIPIPRMGGAMIYAIIMIVLTAFYQNIPHLNLLIAGSVIIFFTGFIDDVKSMQWYYKFLLQSAATVLLILFIFNYFNQTIFFFGFILPYPFDKIILFLFILGTINAFNLLDGLDGLTAGLTLIVSLLCLIVGLNSKMFFLPLISAVLIGSTLGFLKFNANPAQVFLGDTGSLTLGYFSTAAVLSLSGQKGTPYFDLTFPVIVFAVPVLDALRVMVLRLSRNTHPFKPDKNHIHHILFSKQIRHKTTVFIIHGFTIAFGFSAVYYYQVNKFIGFIFYFILLVIFLFTGEIIQYIINHDVLLNHFRKIKKTPDILLKVYRNYILPIGVISVLALVVYLLFSPNISKDNIYSFFIVFIIMSFIYSFLNFKRLNHIAEVIVLLNIIIFYIITGLNGEFSKVIFKSPFGPILLNHIYFLLLIPIVIFFVLFRDRLSEKKEHILTGVDLIITMAIVFVIAALQFMKYPSASEISNTILRSFILYMFYKAVVSCHQRTQLIFYFGSFVIALIAVFRSLF